MTRLFPVLLAGAVLAAGPAVAADLPDYSQPATTYADPAATGGVNWQGAYVGAAVGYGFGDRGVASNGSHDNASAGEFTGTLYGGYNANVAPNLVGGLEAEVNLPPDADFAVGGNSGKLDATVDGNVRARLGYTAGNVLLYGTAGVSLNRGEAKFNGGSDAATHFGYVVGGGIEAALTDHVIARAEYLYNGTTTEGYSVGGQAVDADLDHHTVRVGAGYKF